MKYSILAGFLVLSAFGLCSAQTVAPTEGQSQAASELLVVTRTQQSMEATLDATIKSQVALNPDFAQFENVEHEFISKYLSFSVLRPQLIKIYTDRFSEGELRDLITFYKTPTGQKAITLMPGIYQKSLELAQSILLDHKEELFDLLTKRIKEIDDKKAKP